MAVLELPTVLMDGIDDLLEGDATLAALQRLKAGDKTAPAPPFLRLQAGIVGPAPGLEGSAKCGIWQVLVWITVLGIRDDVATDQLRDYAARIADVLHTEHQAGYANISGALLKVWNIEPEAEVPTQLESYDAITLPFRVTCAAFSAATT